MSMTKQDFIALADALKKQNEMNDFVDAKFNNSHAEVLADFCASQNPNFNRNLWMDYLNGKCGPSGGKVKRTR